MRTIQEEIKQDLWHMGQGAAVCVVINHRVKSGNARGKGNRAMRRAGLPVIPRAF